jgi:hypothetical protein
MSRAWELAEKNPLAKRIESVFESWEARGELRAQFRSVLAGVALMLGTLYLLGRFGL